MDLLNDIEFVGQLALGLFLAIIYLQSGLDKVFDWKGNKSWLEGHFQKSFLSGVVVPMLGVITLVEIITGAFALCGVVCLLWCSDESCIYYALLLSLASLLMLLFGQRIAKDYDGSKTIAIYFGVSLLGLLFF